MPWNAAAMFARGYLPEPTAKLMRSLLQKYWQHCQYFEGQIAFRLTWKHWLLTLALCISITSRKRGTGDLWSGTVGTESPAPATSSPGPADQTPTDSWTTFQANSPARVLSILLPKTSPWCKSKHWKCRIPWDLLGTHAPRASKSTCTEHPGVTTHLQLFMHT